MSEIDHSLRRLGTDYVDLYQIHRWDPKTPIEETLEALHDVVKAGKARYIGASSMYAWQFAKALFLSRAARLDPLRLDAGPLQPPEPRGGARDAPAVRGPGHRRPAVEPAGSRPAHPRLGREHHTLGDRRVRPVAVRHVCIGPRDRRASGRGRRRTGRPACAGGAGMALHEVGRHGADRRRDEARASRRCGRGRRPPTDRRRDRSARGAIRAPRHRWLRCDRSQPTVDATRRGDLHAALDPPLPARPDLDRRRPPHGRSRRSMHRTVGTSRSLAS